MDRTEQVPEPMNRHFFITCILLATLGIRASAQDGDLSPEDRANIVKAMQLHAYTWDAKDLEAWSESFTKDAVTHVYPPGANEPTWSSQSRQELLEAGRQYQSNTLKDTQSRHHLSGILFLESNGNSAKTRCTVLVTHRSESDESPRIAASGIYVMHWQKVDGQWLISRRDFHFD